VFSGGIFHRNVVLEGVSGIPVFHQFHRNFLQVFLRERNSCVYNGFLRIPPDSSGFLFPPNAVWLWPVTKVGFLLSKHQLKWNFYLASPPHHGWTMASTAPVLAPLLPSRCSHHHSIAPKTKAPDDDDVHDNEVGMVVVVVAASGTITIVPVDRCPPRLVDDRYPVAVSPQLLI
jgi:hypothetical protein